MAANFRFFLSIAIFKGKNYRKAFKTELNFIFTFEWELLFSLMVKNISNIICCEKMSFGIFVSPIYFFPWWENSVSTLSQGTSRANYFRHQSKNVHSGEKENFPSLFSS